MQRGPKRFGGRIVSSPSVAIGSILALLATLFVPTAIASAVPSELSSSTVTVGSASAAAGAQTTGLRPAVTGSDFTPGMIISDQLFYDGSAMSAADIQSFLNQMIGSCLTDRCLNVANITSPSYPSWTSPSTGELACAAITGGTMPVSEWIYRVQTACGISAKVILVTLQKEQGLIQGSGARAPGDWALMHAMGMACPDTAPCSTAHAGLATQIYTGTEQLKIYKAARFGRQPGVQYIQWSPNAACGGTYVDVQNYATAALYNYTPYQPNGAALANLYGTGDGCSAYGNRNFWRLYNDWFGSTIAGNTGVTVDARYAELGGASGSLGSLVSTFSGCKSGDSRCIRIYQHGIIGAVLGQAAFVTTGDIGQYARTRLVTTGSPLMDVQVVTDPNGNGTAQRFQYGWVHSSAAGTFWSPTEVMTEYSVQGWLRAHLGWPQSELQCGTANYCVQRFAGGLITGPAGGTYLTMPAAIYTRYLASGGLTGSLGRPTQQVQAVTDPNGNGTAQKFEHGWIHSSSAGTFTTSNRLMAEYSARGWLRGSLGWPVGEEVCNTAVCEQEFAGGTLRAILDPLLEDNAITQLWLDLGGPGSQLGAPLRASQQVTDPNGNGIAQAFAGGWIHSSSRGTFASSAALMAEYSRQGWLRGWLGWPVGAADCSGGICTQNFGGGTIVIAADGTASSQVAVTDPQIKAVHVALGGNAGSLGAPLQAAQNVTDPHGDGLAQRFVHGWIHSSSSGTFATSERLMPTYSAAGWLRGPLGWPTAAESCADGTCRQVFAGGEIVAPAGGAAYVVPVVSNAQIRAVYDTLGGAAGTPGAAVLAVQVVTDPNGNGFAQRFEQGWIHASAAGAFWSPASIMAEYSRQGWLRGSLGWPTSDAICSGTTCTQTFQGGTISVG